MLVLALDTATPRASVAVVGGAVTGNAAVEHERTTTENAGESVVALVDSVMSHTGVARAELTHIAVGVGPGPYTATRIGVMIALGIGHALDAPVVGICTLDAIAAQTASSQSSFPEPVAPFGVATDARRREVYWATYDPAGSRTTGPAVARPSELPETSPRDWAGDGLSRYPEVIAAAGYVQAQPQFPSAAWIAKLAIAALESGERLPTHEPVLAAHGSTGEGAIAIDTTLLQPHPLYLRRPDAQEPVTAVAHA